LPRETSGILNIMCLLPAVPQTFMPLPSRNTSAGRPVLLDTALLSCPFSPPSERKPASKILPQLVHKLVHTRAGFMKRVHKPAMKRSPARRFGTTAAAIEDA